MPATTRDATRHGEGTTPYDKVPQFEIYNVNLSWKNIFGAPVDISLFGTNVKDAEYVTYYSGTFNSLGFSSRLAGMPRMYGARLHYNFGPLAHTSKLLCPGRQKCG